MQDVSVDVREMKVEVERGLSRLARAREAIAVDDAVLSGTPCVKGTRIPAHDIAEMLDNGDRIEAIQEAWPGLTFSQIDAAACYARAYPRRGRPRTAPAWRSRVPAASSEAALDALPGRIEIPDRRVPQSQPGDYRARAGLSTVHACDLAWAEGAPGLGAGPARGCRRLRPGDERPYRLHDAGAARASPSRAGLHHRGARADEPSTSKRDCSSTP